MTESQANKLRIAQVAPLWASIPPNAYGGMEMMVHLLTEELIRRGHHVTLFAAGDSKTSARLKYIYDTNLLNSMSRGEAYHYEYYGNANFAAALEQSGSFDVVHCQGMPSQIPYGKFAKCPVLFTIRTVVTVDDVWLFSQYPDVPIVAISKSQVRNVPDQRQHKIRVIYNGCDFDSFKALAKRGQYLAFLGRIAPHKNPLEAIHIAERVGLPIVLAGRPQMREDSVYFREKIQPLIDGRRVRHIGSVNHQQKEELLRNAAALLFPVRWEEPFGNIMTESMACGTPVVARRMGSVPEVVDPGITGYYGDTVEELCELVPQALRLDREGVREHARLRFSHRRMADEYLTVYRSLLGQL